MVRNTDDFIKVARSKHNEKYDYSKVNYVNAHVKVCIICPKHGEFWQEPHSHLRGSGCPRCWEERKGKSFFSNTDEFIKKAKKVHGDKYDYSKVKYKRSNEKICIICPKHGEFFQTPNKHLSGEGCPDCGKIVASTKHTLLKEDFILRANKVHKYKYNYDETDLNNRDEKGRVIITCPLHGDFLQTPYNHLSGKGCVKCGLRKRTEKKRLKQDDVIVRFLEKHGNKYSYEKVKYESMHSNVIITCHKHGDFLCSPANHLSGKGCPKCKMSHSEANVEKALIENNIKYVYNTRKKTLPWLGKLEIDFYLPEHRIGIECQGGQHFHSVDFFGGKNKLKERIELDIKKKQLCEQNGLKLLYYSEENIEFPYKVIGDIDELLDNIKK